MTACVVCASTATVYCHNDEAYLCDECDVKVHSANPLASRHRRTQVCTVVSDKPAPPLPGSLAPACVGSHSPVSAPQAPTAPQTGSLDAAVPAPDLGGEFDEQGNGMLPDWDVVLGLGPEEHGASKMSGGKHSGGDAFDAFDLDNLWMDRLDKGFDVPALLRSPSAEGLVPHLECSHSESVSDSKHPHEVVVESSTPLGPVPHLESTPSLNHSRLPTMLSSKAPRSFAPALPTSAPLPTVGAHSFTLPSAVAGAAANVPAPDNLTRAQRVERYRQKRKNRKFQKTIRYASRKAYAEIRPRIKGRFAKREEVEAMRAAAAASALKPEADALMVPQIGC